MAGKRGRETQSWDAQGSGHGSGLGGDLPMNGPVARASRGSWLKVQAAPHVPQPGACRGGSRRRALLRDQGPQGSGFPGPSSAHRASAARVGQLQEALDERHSVINTLRAK